MEVKLVAKTQGVGEFEGATMDEIVAGMTRVSTKKKGPDMFKGIEGLLRHMLVNSHWSPFEMVDLTFEISTSMPIAEQYLRHKSCFFQKFSGRYSELTELEPIEFRMQATDNRQSSTELLIDIDKAFAERTSEKVDALLATVVHAYKGLLNTGVARECARFILPTTTKTRMYMKGSLRSWITILNLRLDGHAQKEARDIAVAIKDILLVECPVISKALYNFEGAEDMQVLDQLVLRKYGMYEAYQTRKLNSNYEPNE